MAKTIKLNYDGVDYTLEFTRRTVSQLEAEGFNLNEIGEKPATMIPKLFEGAFLAHHRMAKNDIIWEIYKSISDKTTFMQKLSEMYVEPIETLFDETPTEKNVVWETNWAETEAVPED